MHVARDGWIDYVCASHVSRLSAEHLDLLAEADLLCARAHQAYSVVGAWRELLEGLRPLHILDIAVGRILLAK